jgi:hypothetical protein
VGWEAYTGRWTFPETDAGGQVIGMTCRDRVGVKQAMRGGKRGLFAPAGWPDCAGPVLVPEGPTDAAALTAMGLAAVGRPSNTGGLELLAGLLRPLPADREVIVLGENDCRPDGRWPGKEGMDLTALRLQGALGRPVGTCRPRGTHKDVRAWVLSLQLGPGQAAWRGAAEAFLGHVNTTKQFRQGEAPGPAPETSQSRLLCASMASKRPKAVRWVVPGHVPLGKVVLIAGDGGHGKSTLTLHLAACLSRGVCAFGLKYPEPLSGQTLVIQCEDDDEDTVLPRLLALGADVRRVHTLEGVEGPDGKKQGFTLARVGELERFLKEHPEVKLVTVDPAGAYLGKGVDDHRDSELRALLGPLAQLAAKYGVTIILVKHFSKAPTAKAVQKVGGGVGYVNAVRAAFVVLPDKEDQDRALVLPCKFNVGRRPSGLAFRRVGLTDDQLAETLRPWPELSADERARIGEAVFWLEWDGQVEGTADDHLAEAQRAERGPSKVEQCAEWLKGFLKEYAHPDGELEAAAAKNGHSFSSLKQAKAQLRRESGLRSKKRGFGTGEWWNGFGEPADWRDRPAPTKGAGQNGQNGGNDGTPEETPKEDAGGAHSDHSGHSGHCAGEGDEYDRSREAFPGEG